MGIEWTFVRSLASTVFACIRVLFRSTQFHSVCIQNALTYSQRLNTICKVTKRMIQSKRFFKHFLRATCLWQILFSLLFSVFCATDSLFLAYISALLRAVVAVYLSMSVWIHGACIQIRTSCSKVESQILLSIFRTFHAIQFDRINAKFPIQRFQFSQNRSIFRCFFSLILLFVIGWAL